MQPKLRHSVVFQSLAEVSDGGGGFTTTWSDQFTRHAAIELPRMRSRMEALAAGSIETAVLAEIVVRDDSDTQTVTREWRCATVTDYSTSPETREVWNIRKVYPRLRDGWIRLEAEAGVAT